MQSDRSRERKRIHVASSLQRRHRSGQHRQAAEEITRGRTTNRECVRTSAGSAATYFNSPAWLVAPVLSFHFSWCSPKRWLSRMRVPHQRQIDRIDYLQHTAAASQTTENRAQ